MKICYFGNYERNYSRNRVIINGLKENGVEVIECNIDPKGKSKKIFKFYKLIRCYIKNVKIIDYDAVIVGCFARKSIFIAWLLTKFTRKLFIYDILISLYDSRTSSRKTVVENSIKAKIYWIFDKISIWIPNILLTEGDIYKDFLKSQFNSGEKIKKVYLGADNNVFFPEIIVKKERRNL